MVRRELTEAEWLRRAIRHCEFWGEPCPGAASSRAHGVRVELGYTMRLTTVWLRKRVGDEEDDTAAPWLPVHLRVIHVVQLRARLAALEREAA